MFCTTDSFKVPYNIPNLRDVSNAFLEWIDTTEEAVLRELVGNVLYDDFIAGLQAAPPEYSDTQTYIDGYRVSSGSAVWESLQNGNLGNELVEGAYWTFIENDPWLELKYGAKYGVNNEYLWVGMEKMLTPYLYSEWLAQNFDTLSGVGVTISNVENAIIISPASRIAKAYNDYSRKVGSPWCKQNTLYGYLTYLDYEFIFTYQGFKSDIL